MAGNSNSRNGLSNAGNGCSKIKTRRPGDAANFAGVTLYQLRGAVGPHRADMHTDGRTK